MDETINQRGKAFRKRRAIKAIFVFLPLADMVNGYLIRNHGIRGVGSLYHLFMVGFFLLLWIGRGKVRWDFYTKVTVCFIVLSIISAVLGVVFSIPFSSIGVERESKIICTLIFTMCIHTFVKGGILNQEDLSRIIHCQIWMIGGFVFLCDVSGLYNTAYTGNVGRMGLYSNMNELAIILATSLFYISGELYEKVSMKKLFLIAILMIDMLFIQSKFALGLIVASMFFMLVMLIEKTLRIGKLKRSTLLYIFLIMLAVLLVGKSVGTKVKTIIDSFMLRFYFLKSVYGTSGHAIDYLSSGRTARFGDLIVGPMAMFLKTQPVRCVLAALFGLGFTGDMIYTFEMDPFDVLLFNGILGLIVYISVNIHVIIKCLKRSYLNKHLFVYVCIVASLLVGHVWLGGVCGIYYALFCISSTQKCPEGRKRR